MFHVKARYNSTPIDALDNYTLYHLRRKLDVYLFPGKEDDTVMNQSVQIRLTCICWTSSGSPCITNLIDSKWFPFNLCQHTENENPCLGSKTHLHCQIFLQLQWEGMGQAGTTASAPEFRLVAWKLGTDGVKMNQTLKNSTLYPVRL